MSTKPKAAKPPEPVAAPVVPSIEIVAYKGFDKDLKCRGYQFAVGETFTHTGPVKACASGFHSCENPFDMLNYYPIRDGNKHYEVRASGTISRHGEDSKIASAVIHVAVELKLPDIIKRGVEYILGVAKGNLADSGHAAATGDSGHAAATGDSAIAASLNVNGTAMAGPTGAIVLAYFDQSSWPYRLVHVGAFMVGSDGIEAGKTYRMNSDGKPVVVLA